MKPSRVVALVVGCLLILPSLALLFGGGALGLAYAFGRGDDGYFDTTIDRMATDTVAITAEDITFAAEPGSPDWILDALDADVRLRATSPRDATALFLGIGRQADVDEYLGQVAHEVVTDLTNDFDPVYDARAGGTTVTPPVEQPFWTATATGDGTIELEWQAQSGEWAAVLMNADGSPGVIADVNVGAKAGFILPAVVLMLGIGLVGTALAVFLIVLGTRRDAAPRPLQTPPVGAPVAATAPVAPGGAAAFLPPRHPVGLTARLDPDLSRWKWLVKWFLAIPHFIVLLVLWIAFVVLTLVAAVAIVFTGRYPRGIFDFNVGVLRWSWRVSYYATTGGIGTDRYPPFSLQPEAGDPATLDITYPERLSRGMVFVKWLLAIPHLIIIGIFGSASIGWNDGPGGMDIGVFGGGLLGILLLIAGVALLFTGRYPHSLFDLIVGCNRWIYRTVAYVALMTDVYPPFRLDQGGNEPPAPAPPQPPGPAGPAEAPHPTGLEAPAGREPVGV